jgi:hypothetical protein
LWSIEVGLTYKIEKEEGGNVPMSGLEREKKNGNVYWVPRQGYSIVGIGEDIITAIEIRCW